MKFKRLLDRVPRIRLTGFNVLGFQVSVEDLLSTRDVDSRIAKLADIKSDLEGAIEAIGSLQEEALSRKREVSDLQVALERLEEDKRTTETLLTVPEDSLARLISRATSKSRIRGILEGIVIGLVTGGLSSYLVWYLTKPN